VGRGGEKKRGRARLSDSEGGGRWGGRAGGREGGSREGGGGGGVRENR
jgi:hypothetical protein